MPDDNVIAFKKRDVQQPREDEDDVVFQCTCKSQIFYLTEAGPECHRCGQVLYEYPLPR